VRPNWKKLSLWPFCHTVLRSGLSNSSTHLVLEVVPNGVTVPASAVRTCPNVTVVRSDNTVFPVKYGCSGGGPFGESALSCFGQKPRW
jgi:hypothetical protein